MKQKRPVETAVSVYHRSCTATVMTRFGGEPMRPLHGACTVSSLRWRCHMSKSLLPLHGITESSTKRTGARAPKVQALQKYSAPKGAPKGAPEGRQKGAPEGHQKGHQKGTKKGTKRAPKGHQKYRRSGESGRRSAEEEKLSVDNANTPCMSAYRSPVQDSATDAPLGSSTVAASR